MIVIQYIALMIHFLIYVGDRTKIVFQIVEITLIYTQICLLAYFSYQPIAHNIYSEGKSHIMITIT